MFDLNGPKSEALAKSDLFQNTGANLSLQKRIANSYERAIAIGNLYGRVSLPLVASVPLGILNTQIQDLLRKTFYSTLLSTGSYSQTQL